MGNMEFLIRRRMSNGETRTDAIDGMIYMRKRHLESLNKREILTKKQQELIKSITRDIKELETLRKRYYVQCTVNGAVLETFDTYEEAVSKLEEFEKEDKEDGMYEEDFYEIFDSFD